MNSFSSHIGQIELLNYLKGISADKIYLIHAEEKSKMRMKELLEEEISKMCKSTRVICTNKSTVCNL